MLIPDPMDLRNLSGQYTHGETNRISRLKIPGSVPLDLGSVAHWSLMLCATALGIILGETYQEPQATSRKLQASGFKQKALDIYRLRDYIGYRKDNNMDSTIKLVQKQHDVLVEVLQYLDSTKQSNTLIRSQVDTIVNFEKQLKQESEMELTKITYVGD